MEKYNLVEQVAQELNLTKKEANSVVQTIFAAIEEGLVSGETIRISGFGSFQVKTRSERKGVNPKTGEEIVITDQNGNVLSDETSKNSTDMESFKTNLEKQTAKKVSDVFSIIHYLFKFSISFFIQN